jgi:DNA-binding winged helix-turn-helix (wHTH) protein
MDIEIPSRTIQSCINYCSKCEHNKNLVISKSISLSSEMQTLNIDGKKIKLSNRAFRVLCALLNYNNTVVSFSFLHEYAWPDSLVVRNNLMVTISEIRTIIRNTSITIENIRGVGYLLTLPADDNTRVKPPVSGLLSPQFNFINKQGAVS